MDTNPLAPPLVIYGGTDKFQDNIKKYGYNNQIPLAIWISENPEKYGQMVKDAFPAIVILLLHLHFFWERHLWRITDYQRIVKY